MVTKPDSRPAKITDVLHLKKIFISLNSCHALVWLLVTNSAKQQQQQDNLTGLTLKNIIRSVIQVHISSSPLRYFNPLLLFD